MGTDHPEDVGGHVVALKDEAVEVGIERGVVGIRNVTRREMAKMPDKLGVGEGTQEFGRKAMAGGQLPPDLRLVHALCVAQPLELTENDHEIEQTKDGEQQHRANRPNPSPFFEGMDEGLDSGLVCHKGDWGRVNSSVFG